MNFIMNVSYSMLCKFMLKFERVRKLMIKNYKKLYKFIYLLRHIISKKIIIKAKILANCQIQLYIGR